MSSMDDEDEPDSSARVHASKLQRMVGETVTVNPIGPLRSQSGDSHSQALSDRSHYRTHEVRPSVHSSSSGSNLSGAGASGAGSGMRLFRERSHKHLASLTSGLRSLVHKGDDSQGSPSSSPGRAFSTLNSNSSVVPTSTTSSHEEHEGKRELSNKSSRRRSGRPREHGANGDDETEHEDSSTKKKKKRSSTRKTSSKRSSSSRDPSGSSVRSSASSSSSSSSSKRRVAGSHIAHGTSEKSSSHRSQRRRSVAAPITSAVSKGSSPHSKRELRRNRSDVRNNMVLKPGNTALSLSTATAKGGGDQEESSHSKRSGSHTDRPSTRSSKRSSSSSTTTSSAASRASVNFSMDEPSSEPSSSPGQSTGRIMGFLEFVEEDEAKKMASVQRKKTRGFGAASDSFNSSLSDKSLSSSLGRINQLIDAEGREDLQLSLSAPQINDRDRLFEIGLEDLSFGKSIMQKKPRRSSAGVRELVHLPGDTKDIWEPLSDAQQPVFRKSSDGVKLVFRDLEQAHFNDLIVFVTGQIDNAREQQDQTEMMQCLFATYGCVCDGLTLLHKLIERFTPPPDAPEAANSATLALLQKKVIRCISFWFHEHPHNFTVQMVDILEAFIKQQSPEVQQKSGAEKLCKQLHDTPSVASVLLSPLEPPNIVNPPSGWEHALLIEVNSQEFARQITLLNSVSYSRLKASEFLHKAWSHSKLRERCPQIVSLIDSFNDLTVVCGSAILATSSLKSRIRMVEKLVDIADAFYELRNFNALAAVLASFQALAITRLKHTFSGISKNSAKILTQLTELMEPFHSYGHYREALRQATPPFIPFLGVFLKDLTYIDDGNPNFEGDRVNWTKLKLAYSVIAQARGSVRHSYNFHPVSNFREWFKHLPRYTEENMFRISLLVEPRGAGRKDLRNSPHSSPPSKRANLKKRFTRARTTVNLVGNNSHTNGSTDNRGSPLVPARKAASSAHLSGTLGRNSRRPAQLSKEECSSPSGGRRRSSVGDAEALFQQAGATGWETNKLTGVLSSESLRQEHHTAHHPQQHQQQQRPLHAQTEPLHTADTFTHTGDSFVSDNDDLAASGSDTSEASSLWHRHSDVSSSKSSVSVSTVDLHDPHTLPACSGSGSNSGIGSGPLQELGLLQPLPMIELAPMIELPRLQPLSLEDLTLAGQQPPPAAALATLAGGANTSSASTAISSPLDPLVSADSLLDELTLELGELQPFSPLKSAPLSSSSATPTAAAASACSTVATFDPLAPPPAVVSSSNSTATSAASSSTQTHRGVPPSSSSQQPLSPGVTPPLTPTSKETSVEQQLPENTLGMIDALRSRLRYLCCGSFSTTLAKIADQKPSRTAAAQGEVAQKPKKRKKIKARTRHLFLFEDVLLVSGHEYMLLYDSLLPLSRCRLVDQQDDESDGDSDSDDDVEEDQLMIDCQDPARRLTISFASAAERLQWSGLLQTRLSMAKSSGAAASSSSTVLASAPLLQSMKCNLRFLSCGSYAVTVQSLNRSRKPKYRQRRVFLFEDALIVSQQQYFVLYDIALPLADCSLDVENSLDDEESSESENSDSSDEEEDKATIHCALLNKKVSIQFSSSMERIQWLGLLQTRIALLH